MTKISADNSIYNYQKISRDFRFAENLVSPVRFFDC